MMLAGLFFTQAMNQQEPFLCLSEFFQVIFGATYPWHECFCARLFWTFMKAY